MVRTALMDRTKALQAGIGAMMSGAVPQNRWCEPEEVAEVVMFLCSGGVSHATGHGYAIMLWPWMEGGRHGENNSGAADEEATEKKTRIPGLRRSADRNT